MHSANFYMNTVKNKNASPSKRWQTTMQSALDDVATQLQGNYDRSAMVKDLADRKIANTKTSISFGNERVSPSLHFIWLSLSYCVLFPPFYSTSVLLCFPSTLSRLFVLSLPSSFLTSFR
jgi:hypothetical protein